MFFIGRGIDYALAMEASLKLKEISYIHSEAYAAGELKHGTISLVTEGTVVAAIATDASLWEKTCSNIKEVRARGAYVILFCGDNIDVPDGICDSIIKVPHIDGGLSSLCVACAFQLFAYHTAKLRGCDIDKPRNLAKSVTVE
jgi:glucosamine--fructose-6-phosphate aminotransferase (isomerizing)